MANYLSDRTGANIDSVLDNADAGNIGKGVMTSFTGDLNTIVINGFLRVGGGATNTPTASAGTLITSVLLSTDVVQQYTSLAQNTFIRVQAAGVWQAWNKVYDTGNTGTVFFFPSTIEIGITLGDTSEPELISTMVAGTFTKAHSKFYNDNGHVGSITTNGVATAFVTSSDPRLKDFAEAPTDSAINAEFNSLYSCFRTFNWNSDPQGGLVWGFDAHACIDAGTGIGIEGEGSRNLKLGDVYETIPAVTENRVVMDAEGNPTSEIELVVITAAIEKKVSPAGVDQSKAVPVLLAKIEQLERRLTLAGL